MRKRIQHAIKNENGFVSIEAVLAFGIMIMLVGLILVFFSGAASSLSSYESSSLEMTEAEYAEEIEEGRIALLDTVRDLEIKVEAGTVTDTEKQTLTEINKKLEMLFGSEIEEQVSNDFTALIGNPSDTSLKEPVKKQLDDLELYLLNQAPQQTLSTF
ncbi:hypothetical protein JMA_38670 (plasmid) [Jeotgalibacillus malaysiensis]|uniref:Uncharacterized protein n=1 Tax=Jeotgalibacillus malaysiensis TaxID=1508404 RepID=A0A0B5ASI6_9BACL|nr:hypothetical protein [Jeotgalibacillus malaysiensis]AJD93185.1 hypothetical protein JMA_38670 [Jeotgalibacillus malaysiensis]